jgi:copper homeostasis protein
MNNFLLEVCTDSVESSLTAFRSGATRLELCSNLIIGGTTPSVCLYEAVRKYCDMKINVLIRPRFGDFCYTDYEYEVMKEEVRMFRSIGADGIVIGILKPDGNLNTKQMEEIIHLVDGIPITLHRAFDVCADPMKTLEEARKLGIKTILTSGQKSKCIDGIDLIKELVLRSRGEIDILVGGGVNADVIQRIQPVTKAASYHMSGKIIRESPMIYRKEDVPMGVPSFDEYQIFQADGNEINRAVNVLKHVS